MTGGAAEWAAAHDPAATRRRRTGAIVVFAMFGFTFLVALAAIGANIATGATGKLPAQGVRFVLTIGLFYWVLTGRWTARLIHCILSVGAGGILVVMSILLGVTGQAVGLAVLIGALGVSYAASGCMFIIPGPVTQYLDWRRQRALMRAAGRTPGLVDQAG